MTVTEQDAFNTRLYELLRSTTTGLADAETLRTASSTLNKHFYDKPRCVRGLIEIACGADETPVRQIAAIEARKRCQVHWSDCAPDVVHQVQSLLLKRIFDEPERAVMIALARLVATLATLNVPAQHWPDLVPALLRAGSSQAVAHREIAATTVSFILQAVSPKDLGNCYSDLLHLLSTHLSDPQSRSIRISAMESFNEIAQHITHKDKVSITYFQSQLPTMMRVVEDAMVSGDHDSTARGLAVFDELISGDAPILLTTTLADFVHFVCQAFANRCYAPEIRIIAGNLLSLLPIYKTKQIIKLKLVHPILDLILPITAEPDADLDDDHDSPARVAIKCVHSFGLNFPPAQVFPLISATIAQYAADQACADKRRTSMLILALVVDGCADTVRGHQDQLVAMVVTLMGDPDPRVRVAACMCISALGESLEIGQSHHMHILPAIFSLMQDQTHMDVLRTATNALDTILDGLGDTILPYVDGLMTVLIQLLVSVSDTKMRQVVVGAIGSAANASSEQFKPYFERVVAMILELMGLNETGDHDLMLLRGIAIDTMSAMADAVGPDTFREYLQVTTQLSRDAMNLVQVPKLKECAYCYFGVLARMYKNEFNPMLPELVPMLLSSVVASENFGIDDDGLDLSSGINPDVSIDDSDIMHEDMDSDDDSEFNVSSAIADEKCTAIEVLADLFDSTETTFLPYLDVTVTSFLNNTDHYHESVRKAVAQGLFKVLDTVYRIASSPDTQALVHENFCKLLVVIMTSAIKMLEEEDDRVVASELCDAIHNAMRTLGSAVVAEPGHVESIVNVVVLILEGKHMSQQDDEDDELELDVDELAEYDALLISSAVDVVTSLAHVLGGPQFDPYADRFLSLLAKYFTTAAQVSERSMAVGSFAEIVMGIQAGVTKWHSGMYSIFRRALGDPSAEVRSNGAFGIGLLAQYSEVAYAPVEFINLVRPCLNSSDLPNERDNAVGAIARILGRGDRWAQNAEAVSLLLANLPILADFEENQPVIALLARILRSASSVPAAAEMVAAGQLLHAVSHYFVPENSLQTDAPDLAELTSALRDAAVCSHELAFSLHQSGLSSVLS